MALCHAQAIEHYYHFNQPSVIEHDGYQQLGFENCLPMGQVGEPSLPYQSISLILPQGQEAAAINVEFYDYVEMEGNYNLYPAQQPRPYSYEKDIPFAKNESLYRSTNPYPNRGFSSVNTQYLNGVAFAFGEFTPVRYIPATGKVSYARTVKVTIETTASRDDHSRKLWLTPENAASIKRLAQNDNILGTYSHRGREINGYDMLVITAEEWIPRFDAYLDLYNSRGIRTRIISLEEIYASMDGRDEQEQIRTYISQEYENNGISMVSLGGDVSIVPFRALWCNATEEEQDHLPADMYYVCLDGTLNDDNDEFWGEVGEDDLLPELGIGRLPFNNEEQFNHIMQKTFSYLQSPVLGEFTSPILGAEHLGDGYYGSNDLERLIGVNSDYDYTTVGYPTNYNFKKYYASPSMSWSGSAFRMLIRTGGQYVHHVGHANTGTVAGWDVGDINNNSFANNNGVDHNYMLFHSHGCICGDFSHGCILEKMVTVSTGFVAVTGNSRYGWYVPWGDGMAAHIHREFVDAYCNDHIPSICMALREAKIATAPYVNSEWGDNGCLRWNIYCLNVLGDAALCPWFEEPFYPNVVYENGLVAGTSSTTVHVSHFDTPLYNFEVSLFDGETLLARAVTDVNGNAELVFDPVLDTPGSAQLYVTGQSAWPQIFDITVIDNDEAFIYGDIAALNGIAESGTSVYVSGDLYNKGNVSAHNVHADITTDCEYIYSRESDLTIGDFDPNSTMHFDQIGLIDVADNIPDQTVFTLNLNTYFNNVTHTTRKSFIALAPSLQFTNFTVEELNGDGNGYADPGERVALHIYGINKGHALAASTLLSATCNDEQVQFEENSVQIGDLAIDETFSATIIVTFDEDVRTGTSFHFNFTLQTGAHETEGTYSLSVGMAAENFESGDFTYLPWFQGGEVPWTITSDEAHSGIYCARSGVIGPKEYSRLVVYTDILDDGEITFWVKTSTEYKKDYFVFRIDGNVEGYWSGETDWTPVTVSFGAGSHKFEWYYHKNNKNDVGEDCVWLDDITFPRSCIISAIEESTDSSSTRVYPNPCKGRFNIELAEESDVVVSNILGQTVMSMNKVTGVQQIQLNTNGLYLVQIRNASGVETVKIIAE